LALCAVLDYENYIRVSHAEIARIAAMKRPNVSRAMATLIAKDIVIEGPTVERLKTYRLNPTIAWRGKMSNHAKAIRSHLRLVSDKMKDSAKHDSEAS